ncbi:hypothetical protein SUGI_0954440 [Cryptomeria japonica]|nr:hypothetical protein SUGI_0954440 [Cryptomeria japonica]
MGMARDRVNLSSWIPNKLFVLSALTIQILSYVNIQKVNVLEASNEKYLEALVDNQLRMDVARLTMCVFVGCLLPALALTGSEGSWSNVAALFVSLSFHISTEIYALQNGNNSKVEKEARPWFLSSGVLLLLGASSLLLLLGLLIMCGKIESLVFSHDIPEMLFKHVENDGSRWETFRDEVMKSWVAARTWKTCYFIYSSAFSPGAGTIVTICVVVMAAKVACRSSLLHYNNGGGNLAFYLQCTFILIGWILVLCRWFKTALYCATSIKKDIFLDTIFVFLVASGVVVNPLWSWLVQFLVHPELTLRNIFISVSCLVVLLPLCVLIMPISLLWLFCFICWYLSALVFSSEFLQQCCNSDKYISANDEKLKYHSILDAKFSEEDKNTFWMVNKNSFDRMKHRMEGCKIKESYKGLLSIMGSDRLHQNHEHLRHTKKSWVRKMSNIFSDIADLEIGIDMEDALAAYRETQDVLKFVDCPENIILEPFNNFGTLNFMFFAGSIQCDLIMLMAERKFKHGFGTSPSPNLTAEEREKVEKTLTRIVQGLEESDGTPPLLMRFDECCNNKEKLGEMLRKMVGYFIVSCLFEATDKILEYTKQWARSLDEKKIERAIELAGEVSALLQQLLKDGDIHSEETAQVPCQIGAEVSEGECNDIEAAP